MNTILEIEAAIEKLSPPQMDELAIWLEGLRSRRPTPDQIEAWLKKARGAATPGITTEYVMQLTRGDE